MKYVSKIQSCNAIGIHRSKRRTGYEIVTGKTPDILEWVEFRWYQPVWYYDHENSWPENKQKLARWLGVSHKVRKDHVLFSIVT